MTWHHGWIQHGAPPLMKGRHFLLSQQPQFLHIPNSYALALCFNQGQVNHRPPQLGFDILCIYVIVLLQLQLNGVESQMIQSSIIPLAALVMEL